MTATTADGRPMVPCDNQPDEPLQRNGRNWTPRCNRVAGHTGPHQQRRRSDFAVKAEWS